MNIATTDITGIPQNTYRLFLENGAFTDHCRAIGAKVFPLYGQALVYRHPDSGKGGFTVRQRAWDGCFERWDQDPKMAQVRVMSVR